MEEYISPGSKFYLAFFGNITLESQASASVQISVSNLEQKPQTVSINDWFLEQNITIPPLHSEKIILNPNLLIGNVENRDNAVVVQSLDKGNLAVTAFSYMFTGSIFYKNTASSDMFHVLPCVYLPGYYQYYAMSAPHKKTAQPQRSSEFIIVASENNTEINLILTQNMTVQSGINIVKGIPHTLTLNQAETFIASSEESLSGSHIISNKPISLFSGHGCVTYLSRSELCDHMVDQIPPTSTWGTEFYTVCLESGQDDEYGIISPKNNTVLTIICSSTQNQKLTNHEFNVSTKVMYISLPFDKFCHFKSSFPILLVQFSTGSQNNEDFNTDSFVPSVKEFMAVVPPVKQYRNFYIVDYFSADHASSQERYYLNIVFLKINGSNRTDLLLNGQINMFNQAKWTDIKCITNVTETCAYGFHLELSDNETINISHPSPHARFSALSYTYGSMTGRGSYAGMTQMPIACKF